MGRPLNHPLTAQGAVVKVLKILEAFAYPKRQQILAAVDASLALDESDPPSAQELAQ